MIFTLSMIGIGGFLIFHTITRKGITPPHDGERPPEIDESIGRQYSYYGKKTQYYIAVPILGIFFFLSGLVLFWKIFQSFIELF